MEGDIIYERRKRGILLIASNFLGIVLTTMYISKIIKSNWLEHFDSSFFIHFYEYTSYIGGYVYEFNSKHFK